MPDNQTLSPPLSASDTGIGSGVRVGDGVMLTAGHVMFEFNEASNPANRRVRTLSGSTVFWDPRGYETAYNLSYGDTCINPQTIDRHTTPS